MTRQRVRVESYILEDLWARKMFLPPELHELQKITSVARLSSYKHSLGTNSPSETFGAYMWSTAVSSAFTPLIQAIEISFRNSLNNSLSPIYTPNWFETWVTQAANDARAKGKIGVGGSSEGERLIKKAKEKVQEKDKKERQRKGLGPLPIGYTPAPQAVLAEMSFGFWMNFLTKFFWDVNSKSKLWPNNLADVFPHAPTPMFAQGALLKEYKEVVDLRNRIYHQEPLWKHYSVTSSVDAIAYLRKQLEDSKKRLDFLSKSKLLALQKYGVIAAIEELCSDEAYARFTGQSNGSYRTLRVARKDLNFIAKKLKPNQSIWVLSESDEPRLVIKAATRRFF